MNQNALQVCLREDVEHYLTMASSEKHSFSRPIISFKESEATPAYLWYNYTKTTIQ